MIINPFFKILHNKVCFWDTVFVILFLNEYKFLLELKFKFDTLKMMFGEINSILLVVQTS